MLLVAFSKYTGRAVFDDGSLELLPLREEERLGRREKEAMESGRRERIEEGGGGRRDTCLLASSNESPGSN